MVTVVVESGAFCQSSSAAVGLFVQGLRGWGRYCTPPTAPPTVHSQPDFWDRRNLPGNRGLQALSENHL